MYSTINKIEKKTHIFCLTRYIIVDLFVFDRRKFAKFKSLKDG